MLCHRVPKLSGRDLTLSSLSVFSFINITDGEGFQGPERPNV